MFRFLAALLAVIDKLLGAWREQQWKRQGRQEAQKEMQDEAQRQIDLGEAAIIVPDPDRDERLRNRFDRSRSNQ
jgi:hypothetical protein